MLVNFFWSYATTANGKEMYKKRDARAKKKPGCFAPFAILVAVGRCLVFVEPPSFRLVNKISHLESLSSVHSDGSEWNFIPKKKSKIMTQLPERGAEDNVIIPFAGEPLASQQFIQEYNRNRALEEATTNRGGAKNNALNTSLFLSTQGTVYIAYV